MAIIWITAIAAVPIPVFEYTHCVCVSCVTRARAYDQDEMRTKR